MGKGKLWIGVLMAALLAFTALPEKADAVTSSEIRDQIDTLEEENAALQQQMDALESKLQENADQIGEVVEQKEQIDQQIVLLNDRIENNSNQISAYAVLIADRQEDLEDAQARLAALNGKHKERIRAMEEQGALSYWYVLFQANSLTDLLDRLNMIEEIAASDSRRLDELRDAAAQVTTIKESLETEKAALEQKRTELEQSQKTLDEKRAQSDELMRQLLAKGDEFQQLLAESEEKQNQLMEEIAQMENEYDKKAEEEWYATSVPPTTAPTEAPTAPSAGQPTESDSGWLCPVPYYTLESPFGMRFHPLLNIWRMHNGIDMGCPMDTPIYAARSGIVTVTDNQEDGAGIYVQLNHGDGYRSIYMHMTRYVVSLGQEVSQGQLIGYVGSTGLSSGPHLHFGISYNGTYVNPLEYLP